MGQSGNKVDIPPSTGDSGHLLTGIMSIGYIVVSLNEIYTETSVPFYVLAFAFVLAIDLAFPVVLSHFGCISSIFKV